MRRRVALVVVAALGAATAVLPALAGSETIPAIHAENVGGVYEEHRWQPAQATIAVGGSVTLSNTTAVPHGVEWRSAVKPSCEEGAGKVPVGSTPAASGTSWSGSCSFSQAGSYTFYCTVHGASMSATITVAPAGGTTATTSPTESPAGGTTTATAPQTSPAASALQALKLSGHQHGGSVHGSLVIASAGAGARLQVDLLARRSALQGRSAHASAGKVRVGRLIRSSLTAGRMSFAVPLDRRARRALRRHGQLALTVRILLTPAQGQAVALTRAVLEQR
jgi:plastocyanin